MTLYSSILITMNISYKLSPVKREIDMEVYESLRREILRHVRVCKRSEDGVLRFELFYEFMIYEDNTVEFEILCESDNFGDDEIGFYNHAQEKIPFYFECDSDEIMYEYGSIRLLDVKEYLATPFL